MADAAGVKQFGEEVKQATGEMVADIKDSFGQMLEQAGQSIGGRQLTPQQIQQKQQEEQQRLKEARRQIDFWKKLQGEQKNIQQQEAQKQMFKKQQEEEEKKKKKEAEEAKKRQFIISPAKKTSRFPGDQAETREDIALSRPELRSGHGKGG